MKRKETNKIKHKNSNENESFGSVLNLRLG